MYIYPNRLDIKYVINKPESVNTGCTQKIKPKNNESAERCTLKSVRAKSILK